MPRTPITRHAAHLLAEQLRHEAKGLRAKAAEREAQAQALDELAAAGTFGGPYPLPSRPDVGTVRAMELVPRSRGAAISAGKAKAPTPFQALLATRGVSIPEWVARQPRDKKAPPSVDSVKSWVKKPGRGGRAVPRYWADRIAAEFEAPGLAKADAWPNGIKE